MNLIFIKIFVQEFPFAVWNHKNLVTKICISWFTITRWFNDDDEGVCVKKCVFIYFHRIFSQHRLRNARKKIKFKNNIEFQFHLFASCWSPSRIEWLNGCHCHSLYAYHLDSRWEKWEKRHSISCDGVDAKYRMKNGKLKWTIWSIENESNEIEDKRSTAKQMRALFINNHN